VAVKLQNDFVRIIFAFRYKEYYFDLLFVKLL